MSKEDKTIVASGGSYTPIKKPKISGSTIPQTLPNQIIRLSSKEVAGQYRANGMEKYAATLERFNPEIRNPLLNTINFYIPEGSAVLGAPNPEMNNWMAYYYRYHPLVGSLIDMHCAIAGTPVMTSDGIKSVEDITEEDFVVGKDGKFQKVNWIEPIPYTKEFYTIFAQGTMFTTWTANHPFYVKKSITVQTRIDSNRQEPDGDLIWKRADELELGDYLTYPKFKEFKESLPIDTSKYIDQLSKRNQKVYEIDDTHITSLLGKGLVYKRFVEVNEDLAELCGWYIAEGWCGANHITFTLHSKEIEEAKRISELVEKVFGISNSVIALKSSESGLKLNVDITSTLVARVLSDLCGIGAFNKKIPMCLMLGSKNVARALILSWLKGDGSFSATYEVKGVTVSRTLAFQLQLLATKLDSFFMLQIVDNKHTENGFQYILSISKRNFYAKFYSDIKINMKDQPNRIWEDDNYFYLPIYKIESFKEDQTVYDINTEDSSFLSTVIVHNSELPISRFGLTSIKDQGAKKVYEEMCEDFDMLTQMNQFLKSWFLFGETMPYLHWDENLNRFAGQTFMDTGRIWAVGHYMFFNPDGESTAIYEWDPDPVLRQLVNHPDPRVKKLVYDNLPEELVNAIEINSRVILSDFSTELVARKLAPWDLRGTAIGLGVLKDLMYEDKLRESNYSIAENHVSPKYIWKLGSDKFLATHSDLENFRNLLIQASSDPIFNIISHHALQLQVEGSAGKVLPITPEMQYIEERILTRFFSNKAMTTGGGITYANASVGLRAMMARYLPIRQMVENFYLRKVFTPVALANDFFVRRKADIDHNVQTQRSTEEKIEKLDLPKFDWGHKQNLLDDANIKNLLIQLRGRSDLPLKSICDALDLDYKETTAYMTEEQGTIADPQARAAFEKMRDKALSKYEVIDRKFYETLKRTYLPKDRKDLMRLAKEYPESTPALPGGKAPGGKGGPAGLNMGDFDTGAGAGAIAPPGVEPEEKGGVETAAPTAVTTSLKNKKKNMQAFSEKIHVHSGDIKKIVNSFTIKKGKISVPFPKKGLKKIKENK